MFTYQVFRLTRHENAKGNATFSRTFLGNVSGKDNLEAVDCARKRFPNEKHLSVSSTMKLRHGHR